MRDNEDTIDAAISAHKELAKAFERAAAAYDRAEKAGEIGFEAYRRMVALGEALAASAANLQRRIIEALREVNPA